MRRPMPPVVFTLALLLVVGGFGRPCRAASDGHAILVIDSDMQFAFAETLLAQKKYDQAAAEYERFIHFFPHDRRVLTARFNQARAQFEGRHWQAAIRSFYRVARTDPAAPLGVRALFMISRCHLQLKNPAAALSVLSRLAAETGDPAVADKARYRMGWIQLEQFDWQPARQSFGRIGPPHRARYRIGDLLAALDESRTIDSRSPRTAGLLAVVPGAGYVYCRRYHDALIALVINGAMILATAEAIDNGNPALGGLLAAVELGFYSGSIYGSVSSAHKYNRRQKRRFVDRLKDRLKINLSALPRQHGGLLTFTYRF